MGDILKDIDNHHFEPVKSLEAWLATHKRPYSIKNVNLPGLFNTDKKYFGAVIVAFLIEILGAVFLALDFEFGAGLGIVGGIIGAGALILDFTLALFASPLNGHITYLENKEKIFSSEPKSKKYLLDEVSKIKQKKIFFAIGILLVAAVKMYFFYEGFGMIEMPVLIMGFLFIVVAVIHIFCTDYFFAWRAFSTRANEDKKKNLRLGESKSIPYDIYTVTELKNFDGIFQDAECPHSIKTTEDIVKVKLASGEIQSRYKSIVYKKGLITDADIRMLCNRQELNASRDLAIELLNLQLNDVVPKKYEKEMEKLPLYYSVISNKGRSNGDVE